MAGLYAGAMSGSYAWLFERREVSGEEVGD
jgi:hypothetical protein